MSSEAWKKENTLICAVRIQNKTGIPAAMDKAIAAEKSNKNAYIIAAVREKLVRDGYLSEQSEKAE